jgi:hypothetical protein
VQRNVGQPRKCCKAGIWRKSTLWNITTITIIIKLNYYLFTLELIRLNVSQVTSQQAIWNDSCHCIKSKGNVFEMTRKVSG